MSVSPVSPASSTESGTSRTAPSTTPWANMSISLAAVIEQISNLPSETDHSTSESADRQHLFQARSLLQSWAIITGLLTATSVEHLYLKAPGLRGLSDVGEGKTHGEIFWTALEKWWWASNTTSGYLYGMGESLLQIVRKLHEISPLPFDFDPFNSELREPTRPPSIPGYCSELEALYLADPTEATGPDDQSYAELSSRPVKFSRPWLSEDSDEKGPQGKGVKGEPDDTESVVDSYEQQWRSIIGILYLANLHAMLAIQPFLEAEEKQRFECSIGRFRVWGCSLFSQALSLDTVLGSSQESIERLRTHVIGTLGDIALIEVRLLRSLARPHDKIARMALLQLQSCFGRSEEVNSAVLEIPDSFYDSIQEEEETTIMTILGDQITALIDCLCDVMPAISRVRQVYLLNLEQELENPKPLQNIITTSSPSSPEASTYGVIQSPKYPQPLYLPYETSGYQSYATGSEGKALQITPALSGGKAVLAPPYGPHDPMLEMLAMDLELAEAIKASLASNRRSEKAQSSDDRATMKQIMEWEKEITRLKDWSRVFEKSLSASATPAETEARITAFGRLVNIGCVFASAIPKHIDPKSPLADLTSTEQKIKRMVAAMPNSYTMDVKIDYSGKTPSDALNALSQTNKALPTL